MYESEVDGIRDRGRSARAGWTESNRRPMRVK